MRLRKDGRVPRELRQTTITKGFLIHAEGSALIEMGRTKIICTASVEESVPSFLKGTGEGWVTAEYGMLPRSTETRTSRDHWQGRIRGRTQEIQRLIGRSLRSAVDLRMLGERTIIVDCDVIQADGGTRTASITGGCVALCEAVRLLRKNGVIENDPMKGLVAAVSVGIVGGEILLDLCYEEDSQADVDMNVVMTDTGKIVEVQGTAEGEPFSEDELTRMLEVARHGIDELIRIQREALGLETMGM